MSEYVRYLTPDSPAFDPLELARATQAVVCRGNQRKYTDFYCTGVYGGISTGYTVGCCLRCVFCWVATARDFPERALRFYSAEEVAQRLLENARRRRLRRLRVSGGEPTLGREHLLGVLDAVTDSGCLFILETNGLLLGESADYVQALKVYPHVHVRVSLKAGTAEGFRQRTGARDEFFELPFAAIRRLQATRVSFHVAAMTDPRLMSVEERRALLAKLHATGYRDYLEEEVCDPYHTSVQRLRSAGWAFY